MASYEEVKDVPNHPEIYLVDVRSPDEIAKTGNIPASINIPMPELEDALNLADDAFKCKYQRDKPCKESQIIFSCLAGGRAQRATDQATSIGYTNCKPYKGSWTEWAKKQGL